MASFCLEDCYKVAIELVKEAGVIVKAAFKNKKVIETKLSARDLVTETDKAVEKLLIDNLRKKFPTHMFIGEESTAAGIKGELTDKPTWIIDPIDGTMNFVHSFAYTCISVGLWVGREGTIGIVYNPILDRMYTAKKGQGAFLNGEPIKVSGETDLSKALVITEMGTSRPPPQIATTFRNLTKIMNIAHGIRSIGSAACNICEVAGGGAEAYYEIGIHAWDMAAGYVIMKEAGGYVCDVDGGPFNLMSRRLLCTSSKEIAEQLVAILEIYEEEWD